MLFSIDPTIDDILKKGADGQGIGRDEATRLMRLPLDCRETAALNHVADQLSRRTFGGKGERHFHIGLNIEPCRFNCLFCSLTQKAGAFTEKTEFPEEQVLDWARDAEAAGADALNLMTTGFYAFDRLLDIGRLLARTVSTPLVANTRDISHAEGEMLLTAGFVGCYHAVRLGEGRDTPFKPEVRVRTLRVFADVGLKWMNCVEPIGPEHTPEELAELMFLAREHGAVYSGVMRRVNFPGSPLAGRGMIGEREMARLSAVSRLVMGHAVKAHCVHEPSSPALCAGANLIFPEVGSSPRDVRADTSQGRGTDLEASARLLRDMDLDPDLPSNCF